MMVLVKYLSVWLKYPGGYKMATLRCIVWELPLPKGCFFLRFWAFLVEIKKIAKGDPWSKFQARTYNLTILSPP